METPQGRIGELYIDSTVPEFRGRGVQIALLNIRLVAAKAAGCGLVFVAARPANTSARNTERAGFHLAFTKATFARPRRAFELNDLGEMPGIASHPVWLR